LVRWQSGKSHPVTYPLAESHVNAAACEAGATAELAASCKEKYAGIDGRYMLEPTAVDILGISSL